MSRHILLFLVHY